MAKGTAKSASRTSKKETKGKAVRSEAPSKESTAKDSTSQKKATFRSARAGANVDKSKSAAEPGVLGLPLQTWVSRARRAKGAEVRSGKRGFVFAFGKRDPKTLKSTLNGYLSKWQMDLLLKSEAESQFFQGEQGPVWVLRATPAPASSGATQQTSFSLEKGSYARFRDLAGGLVPQLSAYSLDKLVLAFNDLSLDEEKGALVGLEMASYTFAENRGNPRKPRKSLPQLLLQVSSGALTASEIDACSRLALSVNIARHYVNLPAGDLNPRTYAESVVALFEGSDTMEVDVWEGEKLIEERMNLLLAVGGAAVEGPRLVHLRYRPKQNPLNLRPIAIVGKGITFDTGGLDIKPSLAMRWMKKDMGGSAAAVAIAKWAELTELAHPLDVYLSLAENAVSSASFRPGDIVTARNGLTIEIHNTDAEGRLVLADAIDVAVSQEGDDKPSAILNLATLTGAIKVGLGSEIAGLFCNHDELARLIHDAGLSRGDLSWRMPLYQPYKSLLRSSFADHANASDGFGGAITAALFLELFVKKMPWAHFDIYAWKDSAGGAWAESGGNGQPVQALAELLTQLAKGTNAVGAKMDEGV